MLAGTVYLSLAEVAHPDKHRPYNEWHQLDHRPENLALPGVVFGDRWVRTPECADASVVRDDRLAGAQYLNSYWFREPADRSFAEWQQLAQRSFTWGRRPDTGFVQRALMGIFTTVKGYVAPRVLVSADALPFRPVRGVIFSLHHIDDPASTDAHDFYAFQDRVAVPRIVSHPGVAGLWSFSSVSTTLDPSWQPRQGSLTFDPGGQDAGRYFATLAFLDGDPLEVVTDLRAFDSSRGIGSVTDVYESALLPITPWQWDWFDR